MSSDTAATSKWAWQFDWVKVNRHNLTITHKLGEETLRFTGGGSSGKGCIHLRDWVGHLNWDEWQRRRNRHNQPQSDELTLPISIRHFWKSDRQFSHIHTFQFLKTKRARDTDRRYVVLASSAPIFFACGIRQKELRRPWTGHGRWYLV